jgi:putative membrane-bound dehydrogenase-like protein
VLAQDGPLPAEAAAERISLPDGFKATLFAGEPDVVQPIAMTTDDRGRLWVAECLSYPKWQATGNDRIVWFADKDGDGRHDERQVFADGLANVSALQWGFGGVWIVATPYLQFIPDKDGDGKADGPPVTLLDGFDLNARHNVAAALLWGPDGWLYGCNGILSNSKIGKPGASDAERVAINCGVWRYHPVRHVFEPYAWGTTNPWGLDYNDVGQFFSTNCVIAHLWHVLPGAHFQRMFGQDLNPHTYTLLPTCAEHLHWGGGAWQASRTGQVHSDFGGGHAHSGAMVYLGDNFPAQYRDTIFMCNIHGRRLNVDLLERNPTGYTGKRAPDFGQSADPWFRGTAVIAAADGGIFVSDWSDAGECHDYEDIHRDNGRIFKIVYGKPNKAAVDLGKATDEELLEHQTQANDWFGRHARRLLHERAAAKTLATGTVAAVGKRLAEEKSPRMKLRWMWLSHVLQGAVPASDLVKWAGDADENVAAWAARLAVDNRSVPPSAEVVARLVELATKTESPFVRVHLASALQWLPDDARWGLAEALATRQEDASNGLIGPMLWYGLEPLVPKDAGRAIRLAAATPIPLLREFVARRLGPTRETVKLIASANSIDARRDVVRGLTANVEGLKRVPLPEGWGEVSRSLLGTGDAYLEDATLALSLQFGESKAVEVLRTRAESKDLPAARRAAAIRTLALLKDRGMVPVFVGLLSDPTVGAAALAALSPFADGAIADSVVKHYGTWSAGDRRDAVSILASRGEWADKLLDAIASGAIPKGDVSLTVARQLAGSKHPGVGAKLEKVWGKVRESAAERQALIAKYRSELPPAAVRVADLGRGQAIYKKTCGACHVLFGEGEKIGPELTGAQRKELDYLLENILDPSAVVATDYQLMIVETKDGRSLSGIVVKETSTSITLQMPAGQTLVPLEDIENRTRPGLSLMPEGLLDTLKPDEVRDLFGYLMSNGPGR